MSYLTNTLLQHLDRRRSILIDLAQAVTFSWFDRTDQHPKTRYYVPMVRLRTAPDKTSVLSVSLTWSRRRPVERFKGKEMRRGVNGPVSFQKVVCTYIAQRKKGVAYPPSSFPAASETELADILHVEAQLAPIRIELRALGNLRKSIHAYASVAIADEDQA